MDSIILEKPDKQHPVLDYEACEKLYADTSSEKLDGETIGSPFDIYSVETIRKRLGFEGYSSLPTDVFVWSEGEPKKPYLTKIGGLPYLPKDVPWPSDAEGKPYLFVTQICFVDSKDIVPVPVPGDVLLMFVRHDGWDGEYLQCYDPEDLHFQWVKIADQPMWDQQAMNENGLRSVELSLTGVIHRTLDYEFTDIIDKRLDRARARNQFAKFFTTYLVPAMSGTKIGGIPHYIQDGPPGRDDVNMYHVSKRMWDEAAYICQFTSLSFSYETPFPLCNREKPFRLYVENEGCGRLNIGDCGSIYLFLKPDGTIVWMEECY